MSSLTYFFEYDTNQSPAMPVVDVIISNLDTNESIETQAIVDSGSDASMIPYNLLKKINARQGYRRRINDVSGISRFVSTFPIRIGVAGRTFRIIGLADKQNRPMLLGRDVMNYFRITLDGLANMTEIPAE